MPQYVDSSISLGSFIAYGFLILLYLMILKLLLNVMQRMGDRHLAQRSIIDRDIRRVMTNRVETSMQTFDVYSVALIIAKGGIATLAMAAVIVMMTLKFGPLATGALVVMVIAILYAVNRWLRSREKPGSVRAELRKQVQKFGSMGAIIMLSLTLVILLFVMAFLSI